MANLLLNVKFYKILKWNVADPTFIMFPRGTMLTLIRFETECKLI